MQDAILDIYQHETRGPRLWRWLARKWKLTPCVRFGAAIAYNYELGGQDPRPARLPLIRTQRIYQRVTRFFFGPTEQW